MMIARCQAISIRKPQRARVPAITLKQAAIISTGNDGRRLDALRCRQREWRLSAVGDAVIGVVRGFFRSPRPAAFRQSLFMHEAAPKPLENMNDIGNLAALDCRGGRLRTTLLYLSRRSRDDRAD